MKLTPTQTRALEQLDTLEWRSAQDLPGKIIPHTLNKLVDYGLAERRASYDKSYHHTPTKDLLFRKFP